MIEINDLILVSCPIFVKKRVEKMTYGKQSKNFLFFKNSNFRLYLGNLICLLMKWKFYENITYMVINNTLLHYYTMQSFYSPKANSPC